MALIIDERVAGGRPQKRPVPSAAPAVAAGHWMAASITQITARPRPALRTLVWARA